MTSFIIDPFQIVTGHSESNVHLTSMVKRTNKSGSDTSTPDKFELIVSKLAVRRRAEESVSDSKLESDSKSSNDQVSVSTSNLKPDSFRFNTFLG
jgi:hypothetical protein